MSVFIHSVVLDESKCKGCTTCMKYCPTEAIRIVGGKANITIDRCIDCAQCIRHCPHQAKKSAHDSLHVLEQFKFTVALPAPALYGQFDHMKDVSIILNGLLELGFDAVYEVAAAAELISVYTSLYLRLPEIPKPAISSACPAVVRLIEARFPSLRENVIPLIAPVELASQMARAKVKELHPELKDEEIGTIFISPCPAKVSYATAGPEGSGSSISAVVGINDVYLPLLDVMSADKPKKIKQKSGAGGVIWACTGGESTALEHVRYLACDGISNVIKVLDQLESREIGDLDYIELNACPAGCVGGVMTVENPFVAKARLYQIRHSLPFVAHPEEEALEKIPEDILVVEPYTYQAISRLSPNLVESMRMMASIQNLTADLPGIDCGACGSPNCRAYAEDIIRGLREKVPCPIQKAQDLNEEERPT